MGEGGGEKAYLVRGCISYFTNHRRKKHQNHRLRRLALLRGSLNPSPRLTRVIVLIQMNIHYMFSADREIDHFRKYHNIL